MMATTVTSLDGAGEHVGARLEAFTGIGKLGFLDTMTITSWDPPNRCDVDHTGKVVKGTGTFVVTPLSDHASRFIWSEDIDWPNLPIWLKLERFRGFHRPLILWDNRDSARS